MSFCDGPNAEAGLEKGELVEDWFSLAASSTEAIVVIITTFILYWNCRLKEIPLFVTLQMLLLLIRIPLSFTYHVSKIGDYN